MFFLISYVLNKFSKLILISAYWAYLEYIKHRKHIILTISDDTAFTEKIHSFSEEHASVVELAQAVRERRAESTMFRFRWMYLSPQDIT